MTTPETPTMLADYVAQFPSQAEAARSIGWTQQAISQRLKNRPETGMVWKGKVWIRYSNENMKGKRKKS